MPDTQSVQIQCPNCGTTYQTPIRTVVDVGQNPQLRQAFLSGQLNLALCPNCRQGGLIEVPLVYHDPGAEFLAVYFPPQVQLSEMERQRMIGDLTQGLMRSLPPEQRKGYFLNPRQFVNRQSFTDAVLGTMGVSQEELDRQRKKAGLLEKLLVMADDPKGLEMMIKGQDSQLDYEFFMILSGMLEQSEAAGEEKSVQRLTMLRENLLKLTTWGKRVARQEAAVASLKDVKTVDDLVERFTGADLDEASAMAVAARPLMDYIFFQKLTKLAEAAEGAERDRLIKLRDHLVELTQTMDEAARARMQESVDLLKEILQSPNPRSAVREHADEIDDTFMRVLSLNLQDAQRKGSREAVQLLAMVYEEVMRMVQEGMPPEMRFVNSLLQASYPDETRALLQENKGMVTSEVLGLMDRMAADIEGRGGDESAETAKRLRDIRSQAMLLV
jgi:hypothetical protein